MSVGDQIFVCYIRVAVISEAVTKGEINIAKAWKNSGPQDLVCYMWVTVLSADVTTEYHCMYTNHVAKSVWANEWAVRANERAAHYWHPYFKNFWITVRRANETLLLTFGSPSVGCCFLGLFRFRCSRPTARDLFCRVRIRFSCKPFLYLIIISFVFSFIVLHTSVLSLFPLPLALCLHRLSASPFT